MKQFLTLQTWCVLIICMSSSYLYRCEGTAAKNNQTTRWDVQFEPKNLTKIPIGSEINVKFNSTGFTKAEINNVIINIYIDDSHNSIAPIEKTWILSEENIENGVWSSNFTVIADFLGYAKIHLVMKNKVDKIVREYSTPLKVTVIRPMRLIDTLFNYSVAILASIIYINFGCAMDWTVLKKTLKRPVGPVIGFVSQFLFMPLISYGLGLVLFRDQPAMQLGMFFTGVSPAGGASNIWTYALGGNLNLSITMTTISTIAAFVMMPAWIFSIGRQIFASGNFVIPYSRIASFAAGLIIPLGIGFCIQRFLPNLSKLMVRILKPFASFLILFIIVFATATNLYLFKLFSWQIVVAGLGLPWLGYLSGAAAAKVMKQHPGDILAIAIETGTQNTGIAIFMLRFSLGQPEADLTTVIPVAVAVMTPIPMIVFFVLKKVFKIKDCQQDSDSMDESTVDHQKDQSLVALN